MNRLKTFCILFLLMHICFLAESAGRAEYIESHISNSDSLPLVLTKNHADLLESRLRNQAILQFGTHQLPDNLKDWEAYRSELRKKINKETKDCIDKIESIITNIEDNEIKEWLKKFKTQNN